MMNEKTRCNTWFESPCIQVDPTFVPENFRDDRKSYPEDGLLFAIFYMGPHFGITLQKPSFFEVTFS